MIGILIVLSGLCLGSFFNVVVSRNSWKSGRSRCDSCGHELKWYDLIPVISFIMLRGKCRYCRDKISKKHIASELLMGLGFAIAWYLPLGCWERVITFIAVTTLGFNTISDMHDKFTNTVVMYIGIATIIIVKLINYSFSVQGAVINTAVYVMFALMCVLLSIVASRYVGAGDFDVIFLLFLCSRVYSLVVLFSITISSVYMMIINKNVNENETVAFVPYLYLGYLCSIMLGGCSL